jgi:hypothetical protein
MKTQRYKDSPEQFADKKKRGVINTNRAQEKFDGDYFNLFEPRQIEIITAQSPETKKEKLIAQDREVKNSS